MSSDRRVLFSAQKNEGPFLLEWIAYHKVIGFTDIIIVSNDCDDGSDNLLDALHNAGEITHIYQTVSTSGSPQTIAEEIVRKQNYFHDGDWVMWLDADEFLLPTLGRGHIDDLIDQANGADAIMVAWRFFGDGGNDTWPGRHISKDFTKAAKLWRGKKAQVKTLVRFGPLIERLEIHRPIIREGAGPNEFKVITSSTDDVGEIFYDRTREEAFNRMTGAGGPYELGQVAHFSIRTPDMFEMKSRRGDGYYPADDNPVRRNGNFYRRKNFNETEENGLLRHEDATVREMNRLIKLDGVHAACEQIPLFHFPELEKHAPPQITEERDIVEVLTETLSEGLTLDICDIGADLSNQTTPYAKLLVCGVARVKGFQNETEIHDRLVAQKGEHEVYFKSIVGDGTSKTLRTFSGNGSASTFPVNAETRGLLAPLKRYTRQTSEAKIKTKRLDDIASVKTIDYLKIDARGGELSIIKHAKKKLADAIAVQAGVRFFPLYDGEPSFSDLHRELETQGFLLHDWADTKRFQFSRSRALRERPQLKKQLLEGNIIFIRDLRKATEWQAQDVKKLALLAMHVFDSPDLALFCLDILADANEMDRSLIDRYVEAL